MNRPLSVPPWGASLGVYFVLAGLAAGVTLAAHWVRRARPDASEELELRSGAVALVALVICSGILVVDLGRPWRFFLMVTEFSNLGSAMAVGAKLIALEFLLLVAEVLLIRKRLDARRAGDSELSDGLTRAIYAAIPWLLIVSSVALAIYPAVLLARTWMSPLASTSGAGLLFLSTAMLMGAAMVQLISVARADPVTVHTRELLLLLVVLEPVLLAFEGLSLGSTPALLRSALALLADPTFWGVVVGAGLVVPAVGLLAAPRGRGALALSAMAALCGGAATRLLFFTTH